MKILVTGARGGLAQVVVNALSPKVEWVGVDPRPLKKGIEFPGEYVVSDYHSRKMDDLFKRHKFDTVLHLGRIRESLKFTPTYRFQMNVVGTRNLLNLCMKTGVKNLVVMSTYHVYGAHRLNALHLTEDSPLKASQDFPELADAVELDHVATTFLWKNREVRTTILRPVNIIGKHVKNTICSLLRSGLCPRIIGFDPLMQFIDERDMARALILAIENPTSGIFNVSGEGVIPYSHAIKHANATTIPLPPVLSTSAVRKISEFFNSGLPPYLVDFLKYPTVLSDEPFRKAFGYHPKIKTLQSLRSLSQVHDSHPFEGPTSY